MNENTKAMYIKYIPNLETILAFRAQLFVCFHQDPQALSRTTTITDPAAPAASALTLDVALEADKVFRGHSEETESLQGI